MSSIQVDTTHYKKNYDGLERFISYFHQIDLVMKRAPKTMLEIGIGNKTVADYLSKQGVNVTTCDFDKTLKPDIVADIRELPTDDKQFDVVMACEILEHIPFEDFETALKELKRTSKKHVIISIPYCSSTFEWVMQIPIIGALLKKKRFHARIRMPLFYKKWKFNGQHYWEMGCKNYSLRRIRNILQKHFKIEEELSPVLNSYHYFFALRKND